MRRAIVVVLDSLGVGAAADAAAYGDRGADTLGHIIEACANGNADSSRRTGLLRIPELTALGLIDAAEAARGAALPGARPPFRTGRFGFAAERSRGKDTPSGHWEMMGLPVEHGEGLQVLHYPSGAGSAPHFDFLEPSNAANRASLARSQPCIPESTLPAYLRTHGR